MKGTCKWFNSKKGYGFITGEDKKDYFVHYSQIESEGYRSLQDGQPVEFEVETTEKGIQAVKVKITGEAPAREKRFHKREREGGAKHNGGRS